MQTVFRTGREGDYELQNVCGKGFASKRQRAKTGTFAKSPEPVAPRDGIVYSLTKIAAGRRPSPNPIHSD